MKNACVWEGRDGEGAAACRGAEEGLEGGGKFGEGGLGLGGVGLMDEDVAEACGCDGIAKGGGSRDSEWESQVVGRASARIWEKLALAEGWLKRIAQVMLWEVERERMEEVAVRSQWLAGVLSV